MSKDRVTMKYGTNQFLFFSPHGHPADDTNTDVIAEVMSLELDGNALINRDWKRSQNVNATKSLANCNNYNHCKSGTVKSEFLDVLNCVGNHINRFAVPIDNIFGFNVKFLVSLALAIHGVTDSVRNTVKVKPPVDIIIGVGLGNPLRQTIDALFLNSFCLALHDNNFSIAIAKEGSRYAAHDFNNMTQYIHRKFLFQTIQLEIVYDLRKSISKSEETAKRLVKVIKDLPKYNSGKRVINVPVCD